MSSATVAPAIAVRVVPAPAQVVKVETVDSGRVAGDHPVVTELRPTERHTLRALTDEEFAAAKQRLLAPRST
jgi:hypothetical protein